MTAPSECRFCGAGWVRPVCAEWCERVRAWLAAMPSPPVIAGRASGAARAKRAADRRAEAAA